MELVWGDNYLLLSVTTYKSNDDAMNRRNGVVITIKIIVNFL